MTKADYKSLQELLSKLKRDEVERWENSQKGKGAYYLEVAGAHHEVFMVACETIEERIAARIGGGNI